MLMRKFICTVIVLFIATISVLAKLNIAPGEWQTIRSYNGITSVIPSKENVYVIANGGVFVYNKSAKTTRTLTTLDGISPSPIENMVFVESVNSLFIIHSDLCIDIVVDGKVYTDESIKDKDFSGKKLNNVKVDGDMMYISLDAGIIVYDPSKREVSDTYIIGEGGESETVYQTVNNNGILYALMQDKESITGKKIKVCLPGHNANDYSEWQTISLPTGAEIKQMENACGHVLVLTNVGLFASLPDFLWADITPRGITPTKLQVYKNRCTCITDWQIMVYNEQNFGEFKYKQCVTDLAVYDLDDDVCWVSDKDGMRMVDMSNDDIDGVKSDPILAEGPSQNNYYSIDVIDGDVYLAGNSGYATPAVVDYLRDGEWHSLRNSLTGNELMFFSSCHMVMVDPLDKDHIVAPTWWGVYEFYKDSLKRVHDCTTATFSQTADCSITECVWFDDDNNLIATNPQSSGYLLHAMNKDGEWKALAHNKLLGQRYADHHIRLKSGVDVVVFRYKNCGLGFVDLNGTTFDVSDDKSRVVTAFKYNEDGVSESFAPIYIYSVVEDLKGDLWVATDQGPVIMKNVKGVFDNKETCVRPKVTREDDSRYADYLLSGDKIKKIQVDGKNRKWIATESNGIYLVSPNGDKILESFTTMNTPLSSNSIVDICFDNKSGYLYILTNDGIYIYATDSSLPSETFDNVVVYPNPVRSDYEGDVEIKGLMEESNVRITDQRGMVIENGLSNGGTYRFSARRSDGTRLPTGIYNIFVTTSPDEEGVTETKYLKFAIIR